MTHTLVDTVVMRKPGIVDAGEATQTDRTRACTRTGRESDQPTLDPSRLLTCGFA